MVYILETLHHAAYSQETSDVYSINLSIAYGEAWKLWNRDRDSLKVKTARVLVCIDVYTDAPVNISNTADGKTDVIFLHPSNGHHSVQH